MNGPHGVPHSQQRGSLEGERLGDEVSSVSLGITFSRVATIAASGFA